MHMKKRNLALAFGGAVGAAVAVKMLTRAGSVNWDDVADRVAHSDKSHFINIDGARVHYQEFGDAAKPPIILDPRLYGFGLCLENGGADAGRGRISRYCDRPARIWLFGKTVDGLIIRLPVARANDLAVYESPRHRPRDDRRQFVRRSGGLMLTLDYPETVEKLVLVDSVCNDEPKNHPILKLGSLPCIGEVITPFLVDSKPFMRLRMHGTLAKPNHHLITDERIESIRRPLHAADAHHSVLATSRNWNATRIEQDAHLINQPTLIIWGDQDTVVPIKHGYKLHKEILNSRFVILKDCGHVPHEEKSELFTELVSEFCHDKKGRITAKKNEEIRVVTTEK